MIEEDLYFKTDKNEILTEIVKAEKLSKIYKAKAEFYQHLLRAAVERSEYLKLKKEMEESEGKIDV